MHTDTTGTMHETMHEPSADAQMTVQEYHELHKPENNRMVRQLEANAERLGIEPSELFERVNSGYYPVPVVGVADCTR